MFSKLDIEDAIQKFDRINRPYIVFCHPNDKNKVEKINDIAVIEETYYIEPGTILSMDRTIIEDYYKNFF